MKKLFHTANCFFQFVKKTLKINVKSATSPGHDFRVIFHAFVCGVIFILSFYIVVKKIEIDDIKSAHQWAFCSFFIPLCYLLLCWFFSLCRPKPPPSKRFKSNPQIIRERSLYMKEKKTIKIAIKNGFLPESERRIKIKFPVIGFKDEAIKKIQENEDTSWGL